MNLNRNVDELVKSRFLSKVNLVTSFETHFEVAYMLLKPGFSMSLTLFPDFHEIHGSRKELQETAIYTEFELQWITLSEMNPCPLTRSMVKWDILSVTLSMNTCSTSWERLSYKLIMRYLIIDLNVWLQFMFSHIITDKWKIIEPTPGF